MENMKTRFPKIKFEVYISKNLDDEMDLSKIPRGVNIRSVPVILFFPNDEWTQGFQRNAIHKIFPRNLVEGPFHPATIESTLKNLMKGVEVVKSPQNNFCQTFKLVSLKWENLGERVENLDILSWENPS